MYIAKRPCNFGDHQYFIGDVIPESFIDPGCIERLKSIGLIDHTPDKPENPPVEPSGEAGQENPCESKANASDGVKQPDNAKQSEPDKKGKAGKGGRK